MHTGLYQPTVGHTNTHCGELVVVENQYYLLQLADGRLIGGGAYYFHLPQGEGYWRGGANSRGVPNIGGFTAGFEMGRPGPARPGPWAGPGRRVLALGRAGPGPRIFRLGRAGLLFQ